MSQKPHVADACKAANEDAGEGHMSKSQLYATAKMAIELIDMIKKGDDLEGWVQTKLNLRQTTYRQFTTMKTIKNYHHTEKN